MENKRSWEALKESFAVKESFAEAKHPIFKARKRQGSSWETSEAGEVLLGRMRWKAFVESFAGAKLRILSTRKRRGWCEMLGGVRGRLCYW